MPTYKLSVELSNGSTIDAGEFTVNDGQDAQDPNFSTSVETLAAGSSATVTLSGTYPDLNLHFGIPRGINGTDGQDADNPNFTASASTLAEGSSATVSLSGTYPNLALAFGIPRGNTGATGPTGPTGPSGITTMYKHSVLLIFSGLSGEQYEYNVTTGSNTTSSVSGATCQTIIEFYDLNSEGVTDSNYLTRLVNGTYHTFYQSTPTSNYTINGMIQKTANALSIYLETGLHVSSAGILTNRYYTAFTSVMISDSVTELSE